MKTTLSKMLLAGAMVAGLAPAHASVLTYQDVVFTTSWSKNVLTLEVDAAKRNGDWTRATMLGALSLKDAGSFQNVSTTGAPQGGHEWGTTLQGWNANGCADGGGSRSNSALCLSDQPISLTDNMLFSFAFSGGWQGFDAPHLELSFLDASRSRVGDRLWWVITPPPAVVPPVTPPATPLPVTPPVETGPVPVPPPSVVTPPVLELEPVAADTGSNEVPEPQSIAMLLGGLALMGLALRKRRR